MKNIIFKFFRKINQLVAGRGLSKLPFAMLIYQFFYKILKPKGIVKVNAEGNKIFINAHDTAMAPYLIIHGKYALGETEFFKKILKPGMIFIDVGANVGHFSLIGARLVGESGRVFAFEPDEENFSLLKKNIKENNYNNITAVKKAISDEIGKEKFYLDANNLCSHSLTVKKSKNFVEVETISLDEFFGTDKVDVIKIDVEGAEPAVLEGMKSLIEANKNLIIITEFYPKAITRFNGSPLQYLNDLTRFDLVLYRLNEENGNLTKIDQSSFEALSKGEQMEKLINIVCLKSPVQALFPYENCG